MRAYKHCWLRKLKTGGAVVGEPIICYYVRHFVFLLSFISLRQFASYALLRIFYVARYIVDQIYVIHRCIFHFILAIVMISIRNTSDRYA